MGSWGLLWCPGSSVGVLGDLLGSWRASLGSWGFCCVSGGFAAVLGALLWSQGLCWCPASSVKVLGALLASWGLSWCPGGSLGVLGARTELGAQPPAANPGRNHTALGVLRHQQHSEAPSHRMTGWSGLEGPSVGHPAQPPAKAVSPRAGCTAPRPGGA